MSSDRRARLRAFIVVGGLVVTILAVGIAILLQVFVLNPTAERNEGELHSEICAQAEMTATAYRLRLLGPNGLESIAHFRLRMEAQRHTLQAALGLTCAAERGFPPFDRLMRQALRQIEAILHYHPHHRDGPHRHGGRVAIVPEFPAPESQELPPGVVAPELPAPTRATHHASGGGVRTAKPPPTPAPAPSPPEEGDEGGEGAQRGNGHGPPPGKGPPGGRLLPNTCVHAGPLGACAEVPAD